MRSAQRKKHSLRIGTESIGSLYSSIEARSAKIVSVLFNTHPWSLRIEPITGPTKTAALAQSPSAEYSDSRVRDAGYRREIAVRRCLLFLNGPAAPWELAASSGQIDLKLQIDVTSLRDQCGRQNRASQKPSADE